MKPFPLDPVPVAPRVTIDLGVAEPNYAPSEWQVASPPVGNAGWSKPPVGNSADLQRILALPRREPFAPRSVMMAAVKQLMEGRLARHNPSCRCAQILERHGMITQACITSLMEIQAWTLFEISVVQGLLGPIGVGHGKTALDILAPLVMPNCRLAVLLVPPGLVSQLIAEYELFGQHFRVPSLVVHHKVSPKIAPNGEYSAISDTGVTLHVFPYSRLQRAEAAVWLEHFTDPVIDTVIADEVHYLRNAGTATTSRVLRFYGNHPTTRFCGWSGSVTDSSIKDYGHLSALALKYGSPLPLDPNTLADWARAIDPVPFAAPMGALQALCSEGEHVQQGFHRRLVQTMGVITTSEPSITARLTIRERKAPEIPQAVRDMLSQVRNKNERPDGEPLVDPLAVAKCAREVAQGFYYRWRFPKINGVPQQREHIDRWYEARKSFMCELREFLKDRQEHLDSPLLCINAAERFHAGYKGPLPTWRADTWIPWRDIKDTVVWEPEAIRVNDYLAQDAAKWALENRGVVWYAAGAFGQWVAEISGLPMHGGGPEAPYLIARERGDRSIVASIKAHGTGRNGLQRIFYDQLVASPPSSATKWEQLLGRLYRTHQPAPEVFASFYAHTPEFRAALTQARQRAEYVQTTIGAEQKILEGMDDDVDTLEWELDDDE